MIYDKVIHASKYEFSSQALMKALGSTMNKNYVKKVEL